MDKNNALIEISAIPATSENRRIIFKKELKSYLEKLDKNSVRRASPIPAGDPPSTYVSQRKGKEAIYQSTISEDSEVGRGKKRRISDLGGESSENKERISDMSNFEVAWSSGDIRGTTGHNQLNDELKRTDELLRLFAKDYKKTIISLLTSPIRPEFPESEWNNIIRGRLVDLDRVLSSMAGLESNTKYTESIGSLEPHSPTPVSARRVTTHGEWAMAWSRTCTAIEFAFEHRRRELQLYTEHIHKKFYSIDVAYHDRVILYDRAVRERAAGRSDILLSDTRSFDDLSIMYTSPIGSRCKSKVSQRRKVLTTNPSKGAKSVEICRPYNTGLCPNSSSSCKYRHVCAVCRQTDHTGGKH